ncbi:Protein hunchback like [Actinidia chinensis var. chinensis]|uniref:Protein hunchback like n=1 Tax=Actinidia chinensis var. chinensis TaxID=1590841 RepID=A0A2R6P9G1_ACTCC|nr:Protein hunchback like [Actinidia chinensis var. chinensis]
MCTNVKYTSKQRFYHDKSPLSLASLESKKRIEKKKKNTKQKCEFYTDLEPRESPFFPIPSRHISPTPLQWRHRQSFHLRQICCHRQSPSNLHSQICCICGMGGLTTHLTHSNTLKIEYF